MSHGELVQMDQAGEIVPIQSEIGRLIQVAIEKDLDPEKLQRLIDMKRDHDERERMLRAREAYLDAKSCFLGECPVIQADKKGGGGAGPKWNYPSYGHILEVALPIMSKYGLSHTTTPDFEAEILTCVMKHTLGHEESAVFPMTLEGQNEKAVSSLTLQQKWAHALTFAERQSFKAVSGVPTSDDDVDALRSQPSTEEQRDHAERANHIKRDWLLHRHELDDESPQVQARRFGAWFLTNTDAKTFTPAVNRWTDEQLVDCRKQLDKEAKAREISQKENKESSLI